MNNGNGQPGHYCVYCECSLTPFLSVDSCTYQLEKEELVVSELFEMLDSVRDQIGIVDWGIKMTTLEDGRDHSIVISFTII